MHLCRREETGYSEPPLLVFVQCERFEPYESLPAGHTSGHLHLLESLSSSFPCGSDAQKAQIPVRPSGHFGLARIRAMWDVTATTNHTEDDHDSKANISRDTGKDTCKTIFRHAAQSTAGKQ